MVSASQNLSINYITICIQGGGEEKYILAPELRAATKPAIPPAPPCLQSRINVTILLGRLPCIFLRILIEFTDQETPV